MAPMRPVRGLVGEGIISQDAKVAQFQAYYGPFAEQTLHGVVGRIYGRGGMITPDITS